MRRMPRYASLVDIRISSTEYDPRNLSTASRTVDFGPIIGSNCFGDLFRLIGQRRLPVPPAKITIFIFLTCSTVQSLISQGRRLNDVIANQAKYRILGPALVPGRIAFRLLAGPFP